MPVFLGVKRKVQILRKDPFRCGRGRFEPWPAETLVLKHLHPVERKAHAGAVTVYQPAIGIRQLRAEVQHRVIGVAHACNTPPSPLV